MQAFKGGVLWRRRRLVLSQSLHRHLLISAQQIQIMNCWAESSDANELLCFDGWFDLRRTICRRFAGYSSLGKRKSPPSLPLPR